MSNTRQYFVNSQLFPNGEQTEETKSFVQALKDRIGAIDSVYDVQVYGTHIKVEPSRHAITDAELDELIIPIIKETAAQSGLFPFVTSDCTIRRSGKKNKKQTTVFEVTPTNDYYFPAKQTTANTVRVRALRTYDLNALIAGLNPVDGEYNQALQDQFSAIFGGRVSRINGVVGRKIYTSQVRVTYYSDMISTEEVDRKVNKALQRIFDQHHQFFPHLRASGQDLQVINTFFTTD